MKKNGKGVLTVVLAVIACACAAYLVWNYVDTKRADESYDKAKQVAKGGAGKAKPEEVEERAEIPIDFASLKAVNPDVYAWIRIGNTNIDYPVLQSSFYDQYYLEHDWEGNEASQGAIYTHFANSKDFTDFNTVIYGHQMGDSSDTMFHHLDKFLDRQFMLDNPYVTIYTEDHELTYEVFAAVAYDDRHLLNSLNFFQDSEKQAFLESLDNGDPRNQFREDITVTPADRIISMSTCIAAEPNRRLIVEAVLVDEK